ncbi:hypothetical protein GGC63_005629 [Paenibacillus sp. OAS669]|nr:hypothetical protein [Paenibacillus sp. OAS669]
MNFNTKMLKETNQIIKRKEQQKLDLRPYP